MYIKHIRNVSQRAFSTEFCLFTIDTRNIYFREATLEAHKHRDVHMALIVQTSWQFKMRLKLI
jgi:hypothetical protein